MISNFRLRLLVAALTCAFAGAGASPAFAQETAERMRQLEDQMRALSRELDGLKSQVSEQNERESATRQKLETQVPAATWREGVQFSDPFGNWSLRFFGRGQFDYRQFDPGAAANTFAVRRARLGTNMNFMKYYGLTIEGEYATGSAQGSTTQGAAITNAFMDFNWFNAARLRAGQFKPQFGLENTASANFSDFQERALTQNLLQNLNYDRGIMMYGAPGARRQLCRDAQQWHRDQSGGKARQPPGGRCRRKNADCAPHRRYGASAETARRCHSPWRFVQGRNRGEHQCQPVQRARGPDRGTRRDVLQSRGISQPRVLRAAMSIAACRRPNWRWRINR